MIFKKYIARKTLLILPACCLAFISCGKKPINSSSSPDVDVTPALSKNISFEMSFEGNAEFQSQSFLFEEDGQVTIPDLVHLKSGSPLNYEVRVYFNTNHSPEQRDAIDEFYCSYLSVKKIGDSAESLAEYTHSFLGCFENEEKEREKISLGYVPGQKVFQDQWNYVRLDLVSGYSKTKTEVYAELSVDWR